MHDYKGELRLIIDAGREFSDSVYKLLPEIREFDPGAYHDLEFYINYVESATAVLTNLEMELENE